MSNLTARLPSGATLEASVASLEACDNLMNAILHEAGLINLDLGKEFEGIKTLADISVNAEMINTVKNAFCQLVKSKTVKDAIFACSKTVLYTPKGEGMAQSEKVDRATFEAFERRQDFLFFLQEVAWFNVAPFFGGVSSKFPALQNLVTSFQRLKSQQPAG